MGTVTIYRTRYTVDQIVDGDRPLDDTSTETHENVSAREAADILSRLGLSFAATGNTWAADPDGSYTSDYGTGEETETSGHLDGFPDRVTVAIMAVVG